MNSKPRGQPIRSIRESVFWSLGWNWQGKLPKTPNPRGRARKPSPKQLDTLVRGLPAGSMEHFTNGIQPMLLNYCAKSGCHGPRSSGALRLERIPPNRLAGRHATQGNLQSALTMVNRDSPQESKLLLAPIRRHGTMKTPVFTDREQSQYKQLVEWVYLVSNVKDAAPQPTLEERAAPLLQTVPRGGKTTGAATPSQAKPAGKQSSTGPADWSDSFPDQVSAPIAGPTGQTARNDARRRSDGAGRDRTRGKPKAVRAGSGIRAEGSFRSRHLQSPVLRPLSASILVEHDFSSSQ